MQLQVYQPGDFIDLEAEDAADGPPDNTSSSSQAGGIDERRCVYTHLMCGHTHESIDFYFEQFTILNDAMTIGRGDVPRLE